MRGRTLAVLAACALALAPPPARAALPASTLAARAEERVEEFVTAREFQGRVLIAHGDTVLVERTVGFVDDTSGASRPRIGIGLLARTFTAAAIQRLEMRGKLRLEDSLARFLPDFPHGGSITLEMLLRHRSGVPDFLDDPEYPALRRQPVTLAQLAERIGRQPLEFTPGTRGGTRSSNYALLARVVEVASGMPFDAFVRAELLDSLGLADTAPLRAPLAAAHAVPGWDPGPLPGGAQLPVAYDWSWLAGNGDLVSTPRDLLRWTRAVLREGLVDRTARTYPYGWGLRVRAPLRTIEQGGRVGAGYAGKIVYVLNGDVTVIVLANLQSDAVARLCDDLVLAATGDPLPPPPARTVTHPTPEQLARLAGRYGVDARFPLTVRADSRGAWLAGPDGDFLPLDAVSPTRFRFRVADADVDFDRDSTGVVTQLRWNGVGAAKRLP